MSTRGLVGFKLNGRYVTQYNHSDSYPEWLGERVINFLTIVRNENGWNRLKNNVEKVCLVDEDSQPTADLINRYCNIFYDAKVAKQTPKDWYCLLRNAQGPEGLRAIYEGNLSHYIDGFEFLKSTSCEYAYIINFDSGQLDCYKNGPTLVGAFNLNTVSYNDLINCYER